MLGIAGAGGVAGKGEVPDACWARLLSTFAIGSGDC